MKGKRDGVKIIVCFGYEKFNVFWFTILRHNNKMNNFSENLDNF